jgi:hypothetical protein
MRIRKDTAFISSVLFTIALLWFIPLSVRQYLDWRYALGRETDFGLRLYFRELRDFAIASLAIALIGLIVTWAGYVKKARWTWFVMFVIVWGWAFPDMAYPDFVHPWYKGAISIKDVPAAIIAFGTPQADLASGLAQEVAIFVLMMIALVLPMKSFFWRGEKQATAPAPDITSDKSP